MTLAWAARLTLVLYAVYCAAYYADGREPRGSAGLKALNALTSAAMVGTLVWAGWWS